jgi:hypothetical protein
MYLGDLSSFPGRRPLTEDEKAYARTVFGNAIDYDKVMVTRDSIYSAFTPLTVNNTIHLKSTWGDFVGNSMQHQTGNLGPIKILASSWWTQFKSLLAHGNRNGAYDWRLAHNAGIPWERWNVEQQAKAIEDYNTLIHIRVADERDGKQSLSQDKLDELAILTPYMGRVFTAIWPEKPKENGGEAAGLRPGSLSRFVVPAIVTVGVLTVAGTVWTLWKKRSRLLHRSGSD